MIRFFVKHPTAANILMFLFLVMGAMTLPRIQRETIPDPTKPTVQVQIVYPGCRGSPTRAGIYRWAKSKVAITS